MGKTKQHNFGLSEAQFLTLLTELQQGQETLFEQVFLAHFEDCLRYIQHKYQTNRATAYDVTMDTLLRFRQRLIQGKIKYGNMRFLFTQMAGQHYLKSLQGQQATNTIHHLELAAPLEHIDEDITEALEKAWASLCQKCQHLLKGFYYDHITLKKLSMLLQHSSEAATRKQKQRCVDKLRHTFFLHYHS